MFGQDVIGLSWIEINEKWNYREEVGTYYLWNYINLNLLKTQDYRHAHDIEFWKWELNYVKWILGVLLVTDNFIFQLSFYLIQIFAASLRLINVIGSLNFCNTSILILLFACPQILKKRASIISI